MKARLNTYKKEGALALKHMWYVVAVFTLILFILAIFVAHQNSAYDGGFVSVAFAAIWSMFLTLIFGYIGFKIVFGGKNMELLVGFMIGVASMLAQLFFMLAVIFFALGVEAANQSLVTADADKAYGTFSLLISIIYAVWAIILTVHRQAVTMNAKEVDAQKAAYYDANNTGLSRNPIAGSYGGEDEGDEAEL